jgi:hypothetical protein
VRIVVSHQQLVGFGGTESYLLTIAEGLERLGHDVFVYAEEIGPCGEYARERGLRVDSRPPRHADAVISQEAFTAYALAARYPRAARVFVAHSSSFHLQSPPQAEGACHAVVVMNDRQRRRTEGLARRLPVVRLRQPIDLQRFCFQTIEAEQRRPPRVLLLSNYSKGTRARIVEEACARAGLELRRVGARTVATPTPEHDIAAAEIVVTLGRGALEAMAGGRAAYILGDAGGDGWVTADTYPELESEGFSGSLRGEAIGVDRLVADLADWSEELGEPGRQLICSLHSANVHCLELIELIEGLDATRSEPAYADELARLVRLEWNSSMGVRQAVARADAERARADALALEVEQLRAQLAERSEGRARAAPPGRSGRLRARWPGSS